MTITVQSNDATADAVVNNPTANQTTETQAAPKDETKPAPESTSEQKETPSESGTEAEVDNTESEADETEHEDVAAKSESGEAPTKKKGGFQRRIDKLNQRLTAKDQEIDYWRQQALKTAGAPTTQTPTEPTKPVAAEGKPDPNKFDNHADYIEAVADWKAKQILAEERQKAEKARLEAEQAKTVQTYQERLNEFRAKTEDFDDKIENLRTVPHSAVVDQVIKSSEDGPELLYELAKDPKEAKRICSLPPVQAALEMGKLQAKLSLKSTPTEKPTETKRVSSAPAPIAPVGGGGKASAPPKTLEEAAKASFADYKRIREEQLKQRRRA